MKAVLDQEYNQINIYDKRYYNITGTDEYYPSATTVLGIYPKTDQFYQWLRDNGNETHSILKKAGAEGTLMHDAIEELLNGAELTMINEYGKERFPLLVWEMLCRFMEFAPLIDEVLQVEQRYISTRYKIGCTTDLVCTMDGETWLIDHKSSNNKQPTWKVQLAIYAAMIEDGSDIKIDRMGILWLKAHTRGPRKGSIQGKGWQLIEYTDKRELAMDTYYHLRALWDLENPNYKPHNLTMPNVLKIGVSKEEFFDAAVKSTTEGIDAIMEKPERYKKENISWDELAYSNRKIDFSGKIPVSKKPFRKGTPVYYDGKKMYDSIKEAATHTNFSARKLSKMLHGSQENTTELYIIDGE